MIMINVQHIQITYSEQVLGPEHMVPQGISHPKPSVAVLEVMFHVVLLQVLQHSDAELRPEVKIVVQAVVGNDGYMEPQQEMQGVEMIQPQYVPIHKIEGQLVSKDLMPGESQFGGKRGKGVVDAVAIHQFAAYEFPMKIEPVKVVLQERPLDYSGSKQQPSSGSVEQFTALNHMGQECEEAEYKHKERVPKMLFVLKNQLVCPIELWNGCQSFLLGRIQSLHLLREWHIQVQLVHDFLVPFSHLPPLHLLEQGVPSALPARCPPSRQTHHHEFGVHGVRLVLERRLQISERVLAQEPVGAWVVEGGEVEDELIVSILFGDRGVGEGQIVVFPQLGLEHK